LKRRCSMKLSKEQEKAVAFVGSPALVVAGAGSGKTRTLTAKVAHLMESGHDPERILAITFTNKAADEMKSRLVSLTGKPLGRFPWVRTYHSACFRILREHCEAVGFKNPLQIYAEYQRQKTLQEILARLNIDKKALPTLVAHVSNAKNSGDPASFGEKLPRFGGIRFTEIYSQYQKEMISRNAVDFDDILLFTRDLLRTHGPIRKHYQELFTYILVDEYQDTNDLQEELTGLLVCNGNLFCVGDDWQAIYGFRGSNVGHFLSFARKYSGSEIFRLEQNYRSADEIVQVANRLIDHNPDKVEKRCFSSKGGGIVELHEFYDEKQEAAWVAAKVRSLRQMGISWEKMAVLYRTKFLSLAYEQAFRAAGIPYRMLGSKGFFERREVLDIHCYMASAVFPKDDVGFERIMNVPRRGIGPAVLGKIQALRTDDMSLQEATRSALQQEILAPKVRKALGELMDLLDKIRDHRPDAAIRTVLSQVQYMDYLKQVTKADSMDFTSREENIEQLIYSASQKETIVDYLEEASLVKDDKEQDDAEQSMGVNLSTVHASKGLEYQAAFVVGCEEDLFPHWRSLDSEAGLQEERRLMYVAVTRAQRYLFLCYSFLRKGNHAERSRFLEEIGESL